MGEIEYTPQGVLRKVPASLVVTLFRPFPWEANNFVMVMGALESLMILLLALRFLILKFPSMRHFFSNSMFLMMLIYIILLGFAVGFTSFNFGALARYKIPILSMFVFLLLALNFDPLYSRDKVDKRQLSSQSS